MQYEIIGKIIKAFPTESGMSQRGRSWCKQSFVLKTTRERFVTELAMELWDKHVNDYANFLDMEKPEEERPEVRVLFNLESRVMRNGGYFTSCVAFYISDAAATKNLDQLQAQLANNYSVS